VLWSFFEPARSAVIPNITPPEDMLVANTLSSTTWSFNLAIGSTLGGAVAVLLGRDAVFVLNAVSFLVSALLLRGMHFEEPHAARAAPLRARDLADFSPILEGIRYVRNDARLFPTVFVKAGLGFLGSNLVILPILGERVFPIRLRGFGPNRGALLGMSLLMGARGVGALLGPFVSGSWVGRREGRLREGILAGFLVAAFGYVALGVAPSVGMAIAAVMLAHGGGSTIWVLSTTLLQLYTDDRFRGRVFSADLSLHMLTVSVSSYLAGRVIDWGVPVRTYAIVTGLSVLLPACAWAVTLRNQRWITPPIRS